MKPAFLSYSRKDEADVKTIWETLSTSGIRIWQDKMSLGLRNTEQQIREEIRDQCAGMLIYVTKNSVKSDFVKTVELDEAYKKTKQDPSFFITPIINHPLEETNKRFREVIHGDLSRYNGAILKKGADLSEACRQMSRLILKHAMRSYGTQELSVSLMTYLKTPLESPHHFAFDWGAIHSTEELFSQKGWSDKIRPAMLAFRDCTVEAGIKRIHLAGKAHLTAGFAFGYFFRPLTGVILDIQQNDLIWSTSNQGQTEPTIRSKLEPGNIGSNALAVIVSVVWDAHSRFGQYMGNSNTDFRAILQCSPVNGIGRESVANSNMASSMAKQLGAEIRNAISQYSISQVHIFAAIPLGLACLIGAELNACGNLHFYEFNKSVSEYYPSWIIDGTD